MPQYGELVILASPRGKRHIYRIEEGHDLHTQDGVMAIGPYASFQESQDALVRVATTHPGASIMLAEKNSMFPAIQAVAER